MLHRLYDISLGLAKKELWQRINEGMPVEYNRGLALCFSSSGEWIGVKTTAKSETEYHDDVVYRSGPPNGTDLTPCCKLAGDTSKTSKRLLRAIENLAAFNDLDPHKRIWLEATIGAFNANSEAIAQLIEEKAQHAGVDGKGKRAFLYWAGESEDKPVYDWPEAKANLENNFLAPFARGGSRVGACSICGEAAHKVFGNFAVLACYNLNQPGSIAGGFTETLAHRNLPVCSACAISVAEAFSFTETNLTSSMVGQSYIILPYASEPEIRDDLLDTISQQPARFRLGKARDIVAEENDLVREFSSRGDQAAFALIFFKAEKAAWRVQAEVQQVLPSRMKALYAAARAIADASDLAVEKKEGSEKLHISAGTFKLFSGVSEKASADALRAWLVALFEGRSLNRGQFIHHLVNRITSTGKANPSMLHWIVRHAWGLYRYALIVGLIVPDNKKEDKRMNEAIPKSPFGDYVSNHQAFFSKPELVAAFLTGCYSATVASVQRKERNASPFTKKFVGKLLTRENLRRLYREGHSKLSQYGKLGYVATGLDPDLATAWVACGGDWTINDEEATFAFTIGYSLAYRISTLPGDAESEKEEPE